MPSHPIDLFGESEPNIPYRRKPKSRTGPTPIHREHLQDEKPCNRCKKVLLIDSFPWKRGNQGRLHRHGYCRSCIAETLKTYQGTENGQRVIRNIRLKKYGITADDYDRMFALQKGGCAICGATELPIDVRTGKPYQLAVDHCHKTGRVRSLLCHFCNVGIGSFKDNPKLLITAIKYLRKHR